MAIIEKNLPVTSTTRAASSGPQNAGTHLPPRSRVEMNAPKPPLRMITQPVPLGPTPMSRNCWHACSTTVLVGGPGIDSRDNASSALGLFGRMSAEARHNCADEVATLVSR